MVLVTSLIGAAPAQAADAIAAPEGLAITGDLRVGETVEVSGEGWTPADVILDVTWLVDDVAVEDELESAMPLDLTIRPEWVGKLVEAEVVAEAPGYEPATFELTAPEIVAEGTWSLATPTIVGAVVNDRPVTVAIPGDVPHDVQLSYRWLLDGVVLKNATDATYTPSQAQQGHELSVTVSATRPGYAGASATSARSVVGVLGTFPSVQQPVLPESVYAGQPVAPTLGEWPEGTTFEFTYLVDGAPTAGGDSDGSHVFEPDQVGHAVSVTVRASHSDYETVELTSESRVLRGTFQASPIPVIDGIVRVDQPLTAATELWSPEAQLAFEWRVDGIVRSTSESFTPIASDAGKPLILAVTGTRDHYDTVTRMTAPVTVALGAFDAALAPTISGAVRVGSALTAVTGAWPASTTVAYAWKVSGTTVSTASKFTPTADQRGKSLVLTVKASRTGYATVTRSTSAVTIGYGIFSSAPTPTITGKRILGQTLTVVPGTWSPSATRSYQWMRNGVAIPSATGSSYTLTSSDWNRKITVKVTAKKTGYTTTTRTSAATATITKYFAVAAAPKISGTTRVYSWLKASVSTWSPTASLSYQWKRNGTAISGATGMSYKLTGADYGKTITVTVTGKATNVVTKSMTSAATATVAGPAPVISAAGTYQVGTQIKPGTYVANARYGCYWERRSTAGTSFDGIIANDFVPFDGRVIVTISSTDKYFVTDADCGSWAPYAPLGSAKSSFGNGVHVVGVHIKPGLYMSTTASNGCYWEAVSGFGGTFGEILENDFTYDAPNYVRIYPDDAGFRSEDCGTWTRIGD
ncbi:hypothetical protein ABZ477_04520 [Microbacterium sp. NPDC019599]|uniref:hypothetical protein n=1 Tax=Microbacterium sp. NPDC019599 TaxID=3154690 RepID=UPI0033C00BFE